VTSPARSGYARFLAFSARTRLIGRDIKGVVRAERAARSPAWISEKAARYGALPSVRASSPRSGRTD
jgi:hypothetical protein